MNLEDVLGQIQQDMRQMLDASGQATLLQDYANRIHIQLLRLTDWRFLLSDVQSFDTEIGATDYWIGSEASVPDGICDTGLDISNLWRIKQDSVVNATTGKLLTRVAESPIGPLAALVAPPRNYRNDSSTPFVLSVYPPPDKVYTIQFRYFNPRNDLNKTSKVQIPDDYQDVIVAGINMLCAQFLKRFEDIPFWSQMFAEGKRQMLRDQHGFNNQSDFMKPDLAANTNLYVGPGIN